MNYAALELLFQAYLNLDWPDDYKNPWEAVDDFARNEPLAIDLPKEVDLLLESTESGGELERIAIDDLGCGYAPAADGLTMEEWLRSIARRVGAELA